MIAAEKFGVNADHLREMLVEGNNWVGIQRVTKDLKATVELEAMKAQVKADIKQDMSQALNQTTNQTMGTASMMSQETSRYTTAAIEQTTTSSLPRPFVETVVVTARAIQD